MDLEVGRALRTLHRAGTPLGFLPSLEIDQLQELVYLANKALIEKRNTFFRFANDPNNTYYDWQNTLKQHRTEVEAFFKVQNLHFQHIASTSVSIDGISDTLLLTEEELLKKALTAISFKDWLNFLTMNRYGPATAETTSMPIVLGTYYVESPTVYSEDDYNYSDSQRVLRINFMRLNARPETEKETALRIKRETSKQATQLKKEKAKEARERNKLAELMKKYGTP